MKFAMGGGTFKQTADTLATNDTVEVLIGLSEGPIAGPVSGPKSCYADLTPLVNENGEPNFSAFQLDFWPGSPTGDQVAMLTGGFSSPTQVSQTLYSEVPLARAGLQSNIDAVDFNIVISNLQFENTSETNTETLKLLFEYQGADGVWNPCFTSAAATTSQETTAGSSYSVDAPDPDIASFTGDRQVVPLPAGTPTAPSDPNAVAIDSSGNVYHFDTGSIVWVQAEMTSGTNGTYATFVDTEGNQNITRKVYKPAANPPNNPPPTTGDIWDQGNSTYLIWNGSAWVTPAAFQSYAPTAQTLTDGVWQIVAKITTTTTITIRCFLPNVTTPYSYRVTKQSKDDTTTDFTDCSWDSFAEVKTSSYTFTSLAMLHVLGQASDQFTSLPNWGMDAEGRTVNVPTNYDPVGRTYQGNWDGTYKVAYTNCPAWIFKDFVENTTYGLSSVYPHVCNPWSLYNWSQFCDVLCPTAAGGSQPRYTYNDYVTQQRDASEMANFIAGAGQALMVDDGNGNVDVFIDDPSQAAVALFTEENVSPDGFVYTYTDRLTRANQVIVTFANPQVTYQTDKRIENDTTDQAQIGGIITDQIVATGCTDPDEALRRARRRLVGAITEKEIVSFVTNRKGKYLSEWDVILVADPAQGRGSSGRINSVTGSQTVQLRDPITLEPGFTYTAVFDIVNPAYSSDDDDPYQTVAIGISNQPGTWTQLSFASALPALPEYAVFAIDCLDVVGSPKPYRILTIDDQDGSGENISITALELNRAKQSYIDGETTQIVTSDYSDLTSTYVAPPTDLQISSSNVLVGSVSTRELTLSWTLSGSNLIANYQVQHLVNDVVVETLTSTSNTATTQNCNTGIHTFNVYAVNIAGRQSAPVTLMYDVIGSARSIPPPIDITGSFTGADANVYWQPPSTPDPNFSFYQVSIIDPLTQKVVRNINVGQALSYTYPYATNVTDGTRRSIDVLVTAIDQDGSQSDGQVLNLVNAVPPLETCTIGATPYSINMAYPASSDPDFAGILVYMSQTQGQQGAVVWQQAGQPSIPTQPGQTYYLTYGFYDQFGLSGIILSSQASVVTPTVTAAVALSVGGVDAGQVIADIGQNAENIATTMLQGAALTAFTQGLATLNGEPIGTVIVQNQQQQSNTNSSFASNFTLLGGKNVGGTGWVFDGSTVYVDGTTTLSDHLNYVQNILGDGTTTIASIEQNVTGQAGRITVSVNSEGQAVGFDTGTSGTPQTGYFDILSPNLRLIDTSSGATIIPLSYQNSAWQLTGDVTINGNLLINGSVGTGAFQVNGITGTISTAGNSNGAQTGGNGTSVTIATLTLTTSGGVVDVDGFATIEITSGTSPIDGPVVLQRDGVTINTFTNWLTKGFKTQIFVGWSETPEAGTHTYTLIDSVGPGADTTHYGYFLRVQENKTSR